ncbi:MAG: outer membrane beta-barrel protein [Rickettsiaceae bacterium]|nr:outer membrane beta-barrel protein [Rickettsiaceae bacterium]
MKTKLYVLPFLFASFASTSTFANSDLSEAASSSKNFYIGGFGGVSKTLQRSFTDKATESKFIIKKPSPTFGGFVGYKITPDIMVELSHEQKNNYPITIQLAQKYGGDTASTRAIAKSTMLSFVYNLNDYNGFQPFIKLGVGLEQISLKQTNIDFTFGAAPYTFPGYKLKTAKHTSNCLAYEIGLGVSKKITEDFSINLLGKIHVANNAKLKIYTANADATKASAEKTALSGGIPSSSNVVYDLKTIKQTFGVAEITVGFTYNLPF